MAPTDNEMTISQFEAVDATHPAALIGFLEAGKATPGLRAAKAVLLEELRPRPGQAVLDAGCGYGQDTADLAALVGPAGHAVGVDTSQAMLAEARRRTATLVHQPSFQHGDVTVLPFGDASFDACRAETLLQHVGDPRRAVAELARVTRPGGLRAAGPLPADRLDRRWDRLAEADRAGCFTGGGTAFVAAATKP